VVTVLVLAGLYFLGVDPSLLLNGLPAGPGSGAPTGSGVPAAVSRSPQEEQLADFVSVVLADTEDTWQALFAQMQRTYQEPKLVLFSGLVRSACGMAQAAMGPFYCPADQKVYIDLSFYQDLKQRHGAPGDFAQAYVIAHEVGHHVQNLLGISDKVQAARRGAGEAEGNRLSVRLELQADCLAGVWGNHADRSRQVLEEGDVEEALRAASSIGDDRLQRQSQGYVAPESFTHGTSEQRVRWFKRGISSGKLESCNTFEAAEL
jgi:predicted metalloprotease